MTLKVSTQGNNKLEALLNNVDTDAELLQLWECANTTAVTRLGMSDHGRVHIQIVANACVKILRLLVSAGVEPSVVTDYGLTTEDAEVIVVLATCVHDLGMAIHRDDHEQFSLIMGYPKARQLLSGIYDDPELTIMVAETLHAVISHQWDVRSLSLESGVLKVADALDMTEGRSRIPFEAGAVNIHSVSAMAIESVEIQAGQERPVRLDIKLNNSAGIFQVDELLKRKLTNSSLSDFVEVVAHLEGQEERRLLTEHKF
jgi:hypothetical protein